MVDAEWKNSKGNRRGINAHTLQYGNIHRATHPRKCKHCGKWALKGVETCARHGGKQAQKRRPVTIRESQVRARFYGKYLGPKLLAVVEENLSASHAEQFSLNEELSLFRAQAVQALQLNEVAQGLPEDAPNRRAIINAASECVAESLREVVRVCKTAAEVDSMGRDKFSVNALQDVVNQIVKMVYVCFDDNTEGLQRFDNWINSQLRLPTSTVQGTKHTPDLEALEMDDTIPDAPEEDFDTYTYEIVS